MFIRLRVDQKKIILNWWSVNTFSVKEKEKINMKHASQAHVSIIRKW